jgi:hypothetical protein
MVFRAKAVRNNQRPLLPPCVCSLRRFKGPVLPSPGLGNRDRRCASLSAWSEVPLPTAVEALKIGSSEEKKAQIVGGWNAELLSGDVSLVTSAGNVAQVGHCTPQETSPIPFVAETFKV